MPTHFPPYLQASAHIRVVGQSRPTRITRIARPRNEVVLMVGMAQQDDRPHVLLCSSPVVVQLKSNSLVTILIAAFVLAELRGEGIGMWRSVLVGGDVTEEDEERVGPQTFFPLFRCNRFVYCFYSSYLNILIPLSATFLFTVPRDLGVDGWIILEWISGRWDVGIWTGLGWPRIETGGGRL